MFFKNATVFTLPKSIVASLREAANAEGDASLQAMLAEHVLKPVGPSELGSMGFLSPYGEGESAMFQAVGSAIGLTIGTETKILPPAVIARELAKRIAKLEKQEGRSPGGRARKRLKEEVVTELLPKAFVKPGRINAFIDLDLDVIVVDTASRKTAESVVSEIRAMLGSFPALPLNAETAPQAVLTSWVAGDPLPEMLALGDDCLLEDPADGKSQVRCKRLELRGDEVAKHLESGRRIKRLALTLDEHVSFVFGDDLVIRGMKFLEGALDALENMDRDDVKAEIDARFALTTSEFRPLFRTLKSAFVFSNQDD